MADKPSDKNWILYFQTEFMLSIYEIKINSINAKKDVLIISLSIIPVRFVLKCGKMSGKLTTFSVALSSQDLNAFGGGGSNTKGAL
jgi:hypothetical protein